MGDHSNSGRYLLRFAAQIFRSATVLRASLPPLRRWAALSDEAATAPTPQSVRHGLVCLLTFYRFVRSFVQLLTERYSGVMRIPVCSESVREQKYICQSSCDQKESHRLSFFAFFIVKRLAQGAKQGATAHSFGLRALIRPTLPPCLAGSYPRRNQSRPAIMDDDSPKYVKLISATGTEVHCERAVAISASATMAAMLTSSMREAEENVVRLPDISGPILEKVVQVRRRCVVCGWVCKVARWAMQNVHFMSGGAWEGYALMPDYVLNFAKSNRDHSSQTSHMFISHILSFCP